MRALSFLIVVAASGAMAGCGFGSEALFSGKRIADVSPWEDVGPITICDGAQRLGIVTAGRLGLCEPAGEATSCRADADCRSREACVCGRCVVPVCDSNEECPLGPREQSGAGRNGRVCSFGDRRCDKECKVDGDCAAGERCPPGKNVCRGTCADDTACQTGERCQTSSGLCVAAACESDLFCTRGSCRVQREPAELAEPSPLVEEGRVTLWLERTDPGMGPTIWRAVSTDGLTFMMNPPGKLLDGRAPTVVRSTRAGGYLLLYGAPSGGGVLASTSANGIGFQPGVAPVLAQAEAPSLVTLPDGSFAVYFAVPDGATGGRAVSRAVSGDGLSFSTPETVLEPATLSDPVLWRSVERVVSPFAQVIEDVEHKPLVRLWFSAFGTESATSMQFGKVLPTPPNFSVGVATARDGVTFVPYPFNPVFDRVLEFLTHPSELDPAVIVLGDEWRLYYRRAAADGSKSQNLAVARSPVAPK